MALLVILLNVLIFQACSKHLLHTLHMLVAKNCLYVFAIWSLRLVFALKLLFAIFVFWPVFVMALIFSNFCFEMVTLFVFDVVVAVEVV